MIDHDAMQRLIRGANPVPLADDLGEEDLAAFARAVEASKMSRDDSLPGRDTPADGIRAWRRPAWAFAAAFAAVIVGIGATAWLLQGDTGRVAVDTPTTTVGAPQTTAEAVSTTTLAVDQPTVGVQPSVPLDANALSWRRVELDPSLLGRTGAAIKAVTVGGPGFVAVGAVLDDGTAAYPSPHDGAVWTSPDGIVWSRVPHDPEVFGGQPWGTWEEGDETVILDGLRSIEDVAAGGPGLVAVGVRFDEIGFSGLHGAVWTSEDGTTWTMVPHDDLDCCHVSDDDTSGGMWMRSVTAGGPGLVAVGSDSWVGAVWTSPDGLVWTRVPHDPEVFGEGASWESHVELDSVTNAGSHLFATGFDDGYATSAIWTSTDGITWSRVEVDDARYINDVTEGGPGFVAVGGYEDEPTGCHEGDPGECYAAVWTSTDGVDWTRVPHAVALFGGGDDKQMMQAVTRIGSDLIAVGTKVWVSHDGITWTVAYDDPQIVGAEQNGMYDIAVGADSLVVTGPPYDSDEAVIWVATPAE